MATMRKSETTTDPQCLPEGLGASPTPVPRAVSCDARPWSYSFMAYANTPERQVGDRRPSGQPADHLR